MAKHCINFMPRNKLMNSLHSAGAENSTSSHVEYSEWIAGREIWFSSHCPDSARTGHLWREISLQQAEATSILEERNRMAREIHDTLLRRLQAFWLSGAQNRYQRMI